MHASTKTNKLKKVIDKGFKKGLEQCICNTEPTRLVRKQQVRITFNNKFFEGKGNGKKGSN